MTAWITVHLTVTTPLFNGGPGDAADPSGVRVPSIRGAMRFWYRTLAGAATGPDLDALAKLEAEVFGSTEAACPVPMRIPSPPPLVDALINDPHLLYLLGQGLGDQQNKRARRPYVRPSTAFDLKLRTGGADERVAALTLAALWLTCTFGGLGARTRRGYGGVRISGVTGKLPEPWTERDLATPAVAWYTPLKSLWPTEIQRWLDELGGAAHWPTAPAFPVLDPLHTVAGISGPRGGWVPSLRRAGEQLRLFRASRDAPDAQYKPQRKTPEWLDVVNGHDNRFPLAALGLPVVYSGKGHEVNVGRGSEKLRRASPLWLRAVGSGGDMRLFSFAFLNQFLPGPEAPTVHLWSGHRGRALTVDTDDVQRLAHQWITTLAAGESFADVGRA